MMADIKARDFGRVVAAGAFIGVVAWLVFVMLRYLVFDSVLCRDPGALECASSASYANIATLFVVALLSITLLIRLRVYRPLLVVLALMIVVAPFYSLLGGLSWPFSLLMSLVLYSLVFALFVWLARLKSFTLSIILSAVVILAIKLVAS